APCTGLGLVRRHPETRWRRSVEDVATLAGLQRRILDQVAHHVMPGGRLLYAVCTTTREETHEQVDAFLARHPEFRVDAPTEPPFDSLLDASGRLELHPHTHGTDGFFAVRLRREDS